MEIREIQKGDLELGDIVRVVTEGKISSMTKFGVSLIPEGMAYSVSRSLTGSKLYLVDRPVKEPVHWPPQPSDVWRDGEGNDYHASRTDANGKVGVLYKSPSDAPCYIETLLKKHGMHLVYRQGNTL